MGILYDLGLVIVLGGALGIIAKLLRQPLVLAYIATGILLGPSVFGLIKNQEFVAALSSLGIALLLFTVGLELDLRKLKRFSFLAIVVGLGQVVITGTFGFLLCRVFNFSTLAALYFALALTFSSTAIVIKLLSDNKELDSLHGKFIIATMLIQDVVAIIALIILRGVNLSLPVSELSLEIALVVLKGILFLVASILVGHLVISQLFRFVKGSPELLFLIAIAWCVLLAFAAEKVGLSFEIGAFLAGLSLESTIFNYEIVGKTKPLRDFFLIIFFTSLGMQMTWGEVGANWLLVAIFTLFVLIGNPLIAWVFMGLLGFKKRISFLTGLATSQVSEFSIILIASGITLGHLAPQYISLITLIAIITLPISAVILSHDDTLYRKLGKYLDLFEKKKLRFKDLMNSVTPLQDHIVLFGCDRMGTVIVNTLKKLNQRYLVIDFNLETVEQLKKDKVNTFYGDIQDPEILDKANLDKAKIIISTVPDLADNLFLLSQVKSTGVIIYITARNIDEALELYKRGASYVILPHRLSGDYVAMLLEKLKNSQEEIKLLRNRHVLELEKALV